MSLFATALTCFTQTSSTRATIPATSSNWVVTPVTHPHLSLNVKGNVATGKVRYAGLESLPTDPTSAIFARIETTVLVSHAELAPLIKLNVDDQSNNAWTLTVDTPDRAKIPGTILKPEINVDVLLTMLAGTLEPPAYAALAVDCDDEKKQVGFGPFESDRTAFETVMVETVNLSHCISGPKDTLPSPDAAPKASALVKFPGAFNAIPKAAMYSFKIETVNGTVTLNPASPWSVGRQLSVEAVNGNIDVSGPLYTQFPTDDTLVNLETTNGSIKAQVVGAYKLVAESTNGSVQPRADGVHSVSAESVNGSTTVRAKAVPIGGNVRGESVNGSSSMYVAVDPAVDQVRLAASAKLGSMLAESSAAGWPARSERSKSGFLGKEVVMDLKRLTAGGGEKEKEPVKVTGTSACGSVKVYLVNAEDAWTM